MKAGDFALIEKFPDFRQQGFDMSRYNDQFRQSNIIIKASSTNVSYPEHWGCLSVKCAFGGNEYYRIQDRMYSVNDSNFLILNEGEYYSSHIFSDTKVDSFTLNFTAGIIQEVLENIELTDSKLLDHADAGMGLKDEFIQKLYPHDDTVTPVLFSIRELTKDFSMNKNAVGELYYILLERLFALQKKTDHNIRLVAAKKASTRKELYRRLHYSKDFIDSCYHTDISLQQLAKISCLNSAYLLREFKKLFKVTPYQYLIRKRITTAKKMLDHNIPVADVCMQVGYSDISSFVKLFRRHYNTTPGNYQESDVKSQFSPSAAQ